MNNLTFADLIDIHSLQMMQDSFSKFTGLALCVYDSQGNPVVNSSGYTDFCKNINQCTEEGLKRCNEFDKNGIIKVFTEGKVLFQTCHAGLTSFIVPIIFDGRIIGAIIAGQVRTDNYDADAVHKNALDLGLEPYKYFEAEKEIKYISNEQINKFANFLSDFSSALSVMAYSNYKKITASHKMERSARSQSNLITDVTKELSVTMREWLDDFRAATEKYEGIPEITYETDALLSKGQEVYAVIDGAVDYIRISGGNVEYSENIYNTRALFQKCQKTLESNAEKNNVKINIGFAEDLPEKLVGNSGRISQVISKLGGNIINNMKNGSEFNITASSVNTTYSCTLIIELTGKNILLSKEILDKYRKIIKSGGADIFNKENKINSNGSDLPLIVLMIKQMSGKIKMNNINDGNITFTITLPQLDGNKNNA